MSKEVIDMKEYAKELKKGKKKQKAYTDDSIDSISNDIDRIKIRGGMYIGYKNEQAFIHLIKEVLQNSVDEGCECENGGLIYIDYNEKKKTIIIEDEYRGIPLGKIVNCASEIQCSGKLRRGEEGSSYGFTSGLNGVGLTCANALANYMIITVCRDGKKKRVKFKKGVLQDEKVIGEAPKSKTGTRIEFQPNEELLGHINLDTQDILNLAYTMSFLSKLTIKVHIDTLGKDGAINKTYKSKNGIVDALMDMTGGKNKMLIDPIYFKSENDKMGIEVAMAFTAKAGEHIASFANFCTTIDHGSHVQGFKAGLTTAFSDYIFNNCLTKKEQDKLKITGEDIRNGLVVVVNAKHYQCEFVGQVKEKLQNPDLIPFARVATNKAIKQWIKDHDKEAKKIGNLIKKMAKLREEGTKARDTAIVKELNCLTIDPDKYLPAQGDHSDDELIICEGLS